MAMAPVSSSAAQPAARPGASLWHGLTELWRRRTAGFRDNGSPEYARSRRRIAFKPSVFAGIALLGAFWGSVVAVAELNALYLAASLITCVFILRDFRIGVVLLIVL